MSVRIFYKQRLSICISAFFFVDKRDETVENLDVHTLCFMRHISRATEKNDMKNVPSFRARHHPACFYFEHTCIRLSLLSD